MDFDKERSARHIPVQDMRVPVLHVLRHYCEEEDYMERFEEGWDNIFVVLRRMPAVHVLWTVEEENHQL